MVAFIYILVLYYLEKTVKMDKKNFDINTITASDFSVELDISAEMWKHFLTQYYEPIGSKEKEKSGQFYSPALYLKKVLIEDISEILTDSLKMRKQMEGKEEQVAEAETEIEKKKKDKKKKKKDKKNKKKKRKPID